MECNHCGSTNVKQAGVLIRGKDLVRYRQYVCSDCGRRDEYAEGVKNVGHLVEGKKSRYVVTSALNNKSIDINFLATLKQYCKQTGSQLIVIPVRYINEMHGEDVWYPDEIRTFLLEDNLSIPNAKCKILGGLRISATAENPLSGIDPMSKGDTLIIGHPQVQMRTLPVVAGLSPILWTTGTISENAYSDTKLGYKATFNHSQSALVVDFSKGVLHVRNLNYDGSGFNDLDYRYTTSGRKKEKIHALVTGDEHALFADKEVKAATYLNYDSMVNTLKPSYLVRHDVLDFYSQTHHDKGNFINRFRKHVTGYNSLTEELIVTKDHIEETTPKGVTNIIVSSNHNDHLTKWLNECDPKHDPENAILYHELMYHVLCLVRDGGSSIDPFQIWMKLNSNLKNMIFTHRKSIKLFDIEIGMHGDKGSNGARGSRPSFAKLPEKCIVGHSHSPGWEKGCVQVGTSSTLDVDYAKGSPSSWRHCHCIIHENGKRQVVFITNGKWR